MFGDVSPFAREIERLLEMFSLEEIFEMLDLTPDEVLSILFNEGHAKVPDIVSSTYGLEDFDDEE